MDNLFGILKETPYKAETAGNLSTFRGGKVFRHPGHPPMAELAGTHHEMGLQYGVLLREELQKAMVAFAPAFRLSAAQSGLEGEQLLEYMKAQAEAMSAGIPERFKQELRGIAEGSGMDYGTALAMALSYDLSMAAGCTSILMRDRQGRLMHGRHDDSAWTLGNAVLDVLAIVKYKASGYREVTQPGPILFMGVETGYSGAGICFSEETLHPSKPNPMGGSLPYFVRSALEECDTLEEVLERARNHPFIGGYGMVVSSRLEKKAALVEAAGTQVRIREIHEDIFWNFNQYYHPELIPLEQPLRRMTGYAPDRERLASEFPQKPAYSLSDMLAFLRTQQDSSGADYAWQGSRTAICNKHTQQTTLFDPEGDGFHFAADRSFAGMAEVWHYHEDFSRPPELMAPALEMDPVIRADAMIENMPLAPADKLTRRLELLGSWPEDGNLHWVIAATALEAGNLDLAAEHGVIAHKLAPEVPEYGLLAGAGHLKKGDKPEGIRLLENLPASGLTPQQQMVRLYLLSRTDAAGDWQDRLDAMLQNPALREEAAGKLFPLWEGMIG